MYTLHCLDHSLFEPRNLCVQIEVLSGLRPSPGSFFVYTLRSLDNSFFEPRNLCVHFEVLRANACVWPRNAFFAIVGQLQIFKVELFPNKSGVQACFRRWTLPSSGLSAGFFLHQKSVRTFYKSSRNGPAGGVADLADRKCVFLEKYDYRKIGYPDLFGLRPSPGVSLCTPFIV